jgi:hypothetical protein
MEQAEFLEENVFTDLKNLNKAKNKDTVHYFTEADFATVLKRIEHFGISVYTIKTKLKTKIFGTVSHEDSKKKATDSRWYNGAYMNLKSRQEGLTYSATYKVSAKLLAR